MRETGPLNESCIRKLRVGHLVANYLHITENWIYSQIIAPPATESLVLNRGVRINESHFPVANACHLQDLTPHQARIEADSWEWMGVSASFRRACRRFKCDVLHAHFGTEGLLGLALAQSLGIPLVTSFYGYDAGVLPRDPSWSESLARLFRHGSMFFAEGPALAASLQRLGCPRDRIRIMPLPVASIGKSAAGPRSKPLIVVCGRLVEKKGVDDSLRALAALCRLKVPSFRCLIVGDGPERESLQELTRSLQLEHCVTFAGSMLPADFRRLLGSAALVLQMSRHAADGDCEGGAPVVLSDALALGVPCVATRHCDIPAVIDHGMTGYLVASRDHKEAARRMAELLTDPDLRRKMGRRGLEMVKGVLSLDAAGARLRSYYLEALALPAPKDLPLRFHPLRVPLVADLVIDLRTRARDCRGMQNMLRKLSSNRRARGQIYRVLGILYGDSRNSLRAADFYRRWGRACPEEHYAALEEAKALLDSGTADDRLIRALRRFVARHADRAYAMALSVAELEAHGAGAALIRRFVRAAGTPEERFIHEVHGLRKICEQSARRRGDPHLRSRQLPRVLRAMKGLLSYPSARVDRHHFTAAVEEAIVGLLAIARRLDHQYACAQIGHFYPIDRIQHPLAKYRLASIFENGAPAEQKWAERAFEDLAGNKEISSTLCAGAHFHLARIHRAAGHVSTSLRMARRCLAISPEHRTAKDLIDEVRRQQANARKPI